MKAQAPLVFINLVTPPSPLLSISVDSRPLLPVYYSQPPTTLSSPAMSLLSLCGSYPQSPERSKSFTELQSARERQRTGERGEGEKGKERERARERERCHFILHSQNIQSSNCPAVTSGQAHLHWGWVGVISARCYLPIAAAPTSLIPLSH